MGITARNDSLTSRHEEASKSASAQFRILGAEVGLRGSPASDIEPVIEEYSAFVTDDVHAPYTITWDGHASPTQLVVNGRLHPGITGKWLSPIVSTKIMDRVYEKAEDFFVFHGAAAAWGDVLLAFPGDSGVGKSSLSIGLAMNGWRLFSDEVIAISRASLKVVCFPRAMAVWRNSPVFNAPVGTSTDRRRPTLPAEDRMKSLIPFSQFNDTPAPLSPAAIVCLKGGRREVRRGGGQIVVTYWNERMEMLAKERGLCDRLHVEKIEDFWVIRGDRIEAVEEICTSLGGLVVERDVTVENRPVFGGAPVLEAISPSEGLGALWSVFENGRVIASCRGGIAGLYLELARLVERTPCFWLRPGETSQTHELLRDLVCKLRK